MPTDKPIKQVPTAKLKPIIAEKPRVEQLRNNFAMDDISGFYVRVCATRGLIVPYFFVAAIIISIAGVGTGNRFILSFLIGALFWPVLITGLREEGYWPTFYKMLIGYVMLCIAVTVTTSWWPINSALSIYKGQKTFNDFTNWISNNQGQSFGLFFGYEFLEFLIMIIVTAATAGFGGIIIAAGETNMMSFNAAMLYSQSQKPILMLLLAWPPWWIVKGVAYLFLIMAFSAPLAEKLLGVKFKEGFRHNFVYYGVAGLVLDIILKLILSGVWRKGLLFAITAK